MRRPPRHRNGERDTVDRRNPFWDLITDARELVSLMGTLVLSFGLWILWGVFWFPIIDWVFARLSG